MITWNDLIAEGCFKSCILAQNQLTGVILSVVYVFLYRVNQHPNFGIINVAMTIFHFGIHDESIRIENPTIVFLVFA